MVVPRSQKAVVVSVSAQGIVALSIKRKTGLFTRLIVTRQITKIGPRTLLDMLMNVAVMLMLMLVLR